MALLVTFVLDMDPKLTFILISYLNNNGHEVLPEQRLRYDVNFPEETTHVLIRSGLFTTYSVGRQRILMTAYTLASSGYSDRLLST